MVERIKPPNVAVLSAPGINRDIATKEAYTKAGANAEIVHITELKDRSKSLEKYQVFSIPGGFSYGDHLGSGNVLALEFRQDVVAEQIYEHLEKDRIILGVCNGFQVLVRTGLLPFGEIQPQHKNRATLTNNQPDKFISKWVYIKPEDSLCEFADSSRELNIPLASGEGRFVTVNTETYNKIEQSKQVVYRYHPSNPNGSQGSIAAICDPSGKILGMMPHAEDFVIREHHPNWRRMSDNSHPDGLRFFEDIVKYAKNT